MINITEIASMTKEQVITTCNNNIAMPELIILFIGMIIIFSIIGAIVKKNQGKVSTMIIISSIISAIWLIIVIILPNFWQGLLEFFRGWI